MTNRYLLCYTFLVLFLLNSLSSVAQFSGVKWESELSYSLESPAFAKIVTAVNGDIYLLGRVLDLADAAIYDVIVKKIDRHGNTLWDKSYSTSQGYASNFSPTTLNAVPTSDSGILIMSVSHGGYQLTGHNGTDEHFSDVADPNDVLLFKISKSGDLLWHRFIGGKRQDDAGGLLVDSDGNFIIAGTTHSAFGDFAGKRRYVDSVVYFDHSDSADRSRYYTNNDAFIAKISADGNLLKVKCFGGTHSDGFEVIKRHSFGYVAIGRSSSNDLDLPSEGTKNGLWMVYLDTAFNIIQQKIIDTSLVPGYILINKNEKLFVSSPKMLTEIDVNGNIVSQRNANNKVFGDNCYFDKSGTIYEPFGERIIKYDNSLNVVWEREFPANYFTFFSGVDGVGGNQLFLLGHRLLDYDHRYARAILFSDNYNYVTGKIFGDLNNNNILDVGEKLIPSIKVTSAKNDKIEMSVLSNNSGRFYLPLDSGNYIVNIFPPSLNYTVNPTSKSVHFVDFNETDTINFALQPIPNKKDLSINLLPLNIARPGFPVQYQLICTNQGTETISNLQVKFVQNPRVSFVSASPVVNTTVGDTLIWNIASMKPFDTTYINLDLRIAAPPAVNNSDTLLFKSFVFPLVADETPEDNQFNLVQQVQGSYDPNDKTETHGGIITPEQLAGNDYLTYLIRFQNTGTDTAFTVMIRDTLTNKLDWSSFEMLSSSHPYQLYMIKPHILEFSFPNILLVDSSKNEPASHGFVAYRIKPKLNLTVGDTVLNRAHIYFDYNLPVITNDELTVLRNTVITSVIDIDRPDNQLLLYPNPSNGLVTIFKKGRLNGNANLQIIDMNGKVVHESNLGQIATEQFNQSVDVGRLMKGMYIVRLQTGRDIYQCKFIIQ